MNIVNYSIFSFFFPQILLWVTSYAIENPSIRLSQPVNTEKYVELTCDRTLPALVSFLTYNFILVFLCFLLAFKTRKLPDNFNESRFMSMCASFTLVMWLAFVPTYFSANLESIRVLLLSASLLLNHTVALAFLILPKIYAAICVTPEPFVIGRFQITGCKISENSNRIAPTAESTWTNVKRSKRHYIRKSQWFTAIYKWQKMVVTPRLFASLTIKMSPFTLGTAMSKFLRAWYANLII